MTRTWPYWYIAAFVVVVALPWPWAVLPWLIGCWRLWREA